MSQNANSSSSLSLPLPLPERPSLDYLKDQAKRLLRRIRADEPEALALLHALHPAFHGRALSSVPALHDAQLALARQHGFTSWNRLKHAVEEKLAQALPWERQLLRAVWHGRLEDVQTLLEDGGRPIPAEILPEFAKALEGIADRSVWHRPFYREIARLLLAAEVDCHIWAAARLGLLDVVQARLEADPQLLTARDSQGRTPLQRASLIYGSDAECEKVVPWLIAQGAPVDLHTACAYAMVELVEAELRRVPGQVNVKVQGSAPLNWAVRPRGATHPHYGTEADARVCELLLDAGADVETADENENGMHPLHHLGGWMGNPQSADLLLSRGADLQALDDAGWTPLDYALSRNREPMIEFLKGRGARITRVEWPNTWGDRRQAILAAAKRNDLSGVRQLLELDTTLARARGEDGDTPLHWAAHDGHYEVAALLLQHGAEVAAQETRYWGGTPLHWAAERQPVLVQLLLDHGADVNSRNERTGQTPLHYCARCDDVPEVATLLLSRGADPSITDKRGNSPLDFALRRDDSQVAATLRQWEQNKEVATHE